MDIHQWPFPIAGTQEELWHLIENYGEQDNLKKIEEHHRMMGNTETGHACEEIRKRIAEVCGK